MQNIPRIGLGTWKLKGPFCKEAVQSALSFGYTHVDTAQIYENEEEVGKGVRNYLAKGEKTRKDIWITTKVWIDYYDRLKNSVEASLKRLKMEYIDLLLLHRPINIAVHEKCFDEMMKLQDIGKVRHIGVSNFTLSQMIHAWEYTGGRIYTNQVEYHPCLSQDAMKAFCEEHDVALTAYSPLGYGNLLENQTLQTIAEKYGISVAQVCLVRLLQQGCIVIPKSKNEGRMKENLVSLSLTLDEEDVAVIAALPKTYRYMNPPFAPEWDE